MPVPFRSFRLASIAVLTLAVAPLAHAQAAQPQSSTPAPSPGAATQDGPVMPKVSDPMLTPVPAAETNVANWQEALGYVRARSTDLRTAYDEVKRAEAQQRVALAGALPTISANAVGTAQLITKDTSATQQAISSASGSGNPTSTPVSPTLTAGASIVQPLLALRAWHTIGTAKYSKEASQLSLSDLKRNIALGVANALVGVITAERVAELNRVGLRQSLELLDITTRKQALGSATGLDIVRAKQNVENARSTLVSGDESLRQARESLGLALGVSMPVGVTRDINIDGLERDAEMACKPSERIDDRPDVAAARVKATIANRNVDDVWLQFAPTINAQSSLNTTSVQSTVPTTWNIQAVLSVPLWEGGARYGALHDTRAQEDEALASVENLRRQATIQVAQAKRGVQVAEDSRAVLSRARDLAAETDRLTRIGYQTGSLTSLDLVTASTALRQADINLALQDFGVVKARVLAILSLASCPW